MKAVIPTLVMMLVLTAIMVPANAAALSYPDVTGTYDVSSKAAPRYMDNARHPRIQFDTLVITTQSGKSITDATLQHMGTDVALTQR